MSPNPSSPRRAPHPWWRSIAVASLSAVGTAVAVGSLLAARLELDGFGRPRDTSPRPAYLLALGLAVAGGAVLPWVVARLLLSDSWWVLPAIGLGVTLVLVLVLLGLG